MPPPKPPLQAPSQPEKRPTGRPPEVADAEKTSNAPQAALTRNGLGKDQQDEGSPRSAEDARESDNAAPLPDSDAARETLPNQPAQEAHRKSAIAPPGPKRIQATARRPDANAKDNQAAEKKKDVQCGPPTPKRPPTTTDEAVVLGFLTPEQAAAGVAKSEARFNWHIAPRFRNAPRAFVHIYRSPPGAWVVVAFPPGMIVGRGDRVEVRRGYPDPSHPCQYVPNIIVRTI